MTAKSRILETTRIERKIGETASAAFASSVAVAPGDSTFNLTPVPFRSSAKVRGRLRTAALLAL
jgi:hypothetical protein